MILDRAERYRSAVGHSPKFLSPTLVHRVIYSTKGNDNLCIIIILINNTNFIWHNILLF